MKSAFFLLCVICAIGFPASAVWLTALHHRCSSLEQELGLHRKAHAEQLKKLDERDQAVREFIAREQNRTIWPGWLFDPHRLEWRRLMREEETKAPGPKREPVKADAGASPTDGRE